MRALGREPGTLCRQKLLGYLYGISGERRLAEECRYNLTFRLAREGTPGDVCATTRCSCHVRREEAALCGLLLYMHVS